MIQPEVRAVSVLTVRHVTTYTYRQAVAFGEHRMMLRPREGYDQRLLDARLTALEADLGSLDGLLVAFSGGADSAFLLAAAVRALGPDRVVAATAVSPSLAADELPSAQAFAAGLVDDVHLFLSPVIVGGGTRALPDGVRLDLELVDERRFANGAVHLHHRAQS